MEQFQQRVFLGFVAVATVAMAWIASPFYGAILWALTAAIVFAPANAALAKALNGHRNTAAGLTLLGIIAMVIVPAAIIGSLLVEEAIGTYQDLQTQPLDIGVTLESLRRSMAVVFQENMLFNMSIRENIRLGKEGATDEEVEEASDPRGGVGAGSRPATAAMASNRGGRCVRIFLATPGRHAVG